MTVTTRQWRAWQRRAATIERLAHALWQDIAEHGHIYPLTSDDALETKRAATKVLGDMIWQAECTKAERRRP